MLVDNIGQIHLELFSGVRMNIERRLCCGRVLDDKKKSAL
jgi:hypothetical protein